MNVPVYAVVVTVALLGVLGYAPARVIARSRAWAVVLTPAAGALACATAAALCVLTRTSMVPWLVVLATAGWIALWLACRRDRVVNRPGPGERWTLAAVGAVALVPVVLVDLPATVSDARSIWWLHAAWFRAGGALADEAMSNPAYGASLPAHPPLVPGVIAAVWHLGDAYDRELALRVSQLVAAYAAAALGFVTTWALKLSGRTAVAIGAAVTWLAWSAKVTVGLNGLLDLTWALFLVAGAVLWLAGDTDRRTLAAGALFVAAAVLTKSEGQAAAVVLVGLTTIRLLRLGRRLPSLALVVVPVVAAAGMWRLVATPTSYDTGDLSNAPDLLDPGSAAWERMTTSLDAFAGHLGPVGWGGVAVVVLVVVLGRSRSTAVRQPGLVAILVLAGGLLVVNAAVYALRPEDMATLLQSAAYRTVVVIRLLVLVDVVLALVAAWRALQPADPVLAPGTRIMTRR